ncbi:hypothetical protein C8J56DRAFT_875883 [Mycena floridula]|nr:hypothetical protein C8J56DRAFT_875883 [Mycena floridula]
MASQSSQIYYIVDNTAEEVEYDKSDSESAIISFNQTRTMFSGMQMNFDGTSVSFSGIDQASPSLVTTIDQNPPSSLSMYPKFCGQFYQSPTLDDTAKIHTINATVSTPLGSIFLDYILVSPRKETLLLGRTLMADDMYSGLNFGSGWVTTEMVFNLHPLFLLFPFQNTTHRASTPGSIFSFSYTGSSLSLYGVFDWDQLGSYELTSTIDDEPPVSKIFDARNDLNPNKYQQQPNFLLFSTEELEAGNHTVTFTLSKCVNQTLIVDYITYAPSFSTLLTMPNLTGLTFPFDVPTAGPTSPTNSSFPAPNNPANSKSHMAALVAGLVAALCLLSCLILLCIWWHRRRQNRPSIPVKSDSEQALSIEPFHSIFRSTMHSKRHKQPIASSLDQVQISMTRRMQIQEEQIQAMRAELDALAHPPDYQSR